jgi:hypothetical protein
VGALSSAERGDSGSIASSRPCAAGFRRVGRRVKPGEAIEGTSGTLFASHKLPLRGYLAAIAVFCDEVKGKSALALSRDLGLSYKSAFKRGTFSATFFLACLAPMELEGVILEEI